MKHIFCKVIICTGMVLMSSAIWAQDNNVTSDAEKVEAEILLRSGDVLTVQITDMKSNYVAYVLNGQAYTIPASQVVKVTFPQNGQVKEYNGQSISNVESVKSNGSSGKEVISKPSGRIYRDNGEYLYNDTYISSKEVAKILKRENNAAYTKWKKAEGMLIGGAICTSVGSLMAVGGLVSLVGKDPMPCLIIDCCAIVPLGIGLGLTLGASSQFNKAIDIYNSKYDQAAVQLKWGIAPTGVGLALVF